MNIRDEILDSVIREIVGPCPNRHYLDNETGEEILLASIHGSPKSRYGAGMLYPQNEINNEEVDGDEVDTSENEIDSDNVIDFFLGETEENKRVRNFSGDEQDEEPVGLANQYLPSAMGFTVRFNSLEKNDKVELMVSSAYYQKAKGKKPKKQIDKEGKVIVYQDKNGKSYDSDYWIRRPINPEPLVINIGSLFSDGTKSFNRVLKKDSSGGDWLSLRIFNRTTEEDKKENLITYTFVIINVQKSVTDDSKNADKILFQNELILKTANTALIAPYKERVLSSDTNEEKELNLLYRNKRIFSIGHGTSVLWDKNEDSNSISQIKTSVVPVYDLPQVAPTEHVKLSMLELSDFFRRVLLGRVSHAGMGSASSGSGDSLCGMGRL